MFVTAFIDCLEACCMCVFLILSKSAISILPPEICHFFNDSRNINTRMNNDFRHLWYPNFLPNKDTLWNTLPHHMLYYWIHFIFNNYFRFWGWVICMHIIYTQNLFCYIKWWFVKKPVCDDKLVTNIGCKC